MSHQPPLNLGTQTLPWLVFSFSWFVIESLVGTSSSQLKTQISP